MSEELTTDNRPEYLKKRVLVPSISAVFFLICGIFFSIRGIYYKSTDDAFVEGHIVTMASRVNSQVEELKIDDNMQVKKGDLLLVLDDSDYKAKLEQSKGALEEAKSALIVADNEMQKSFSELEFAKNDYERYRLMKEKGIASTQDYEAAKTKLSSANALNRMASANFEKIKGNIKKLEAKVKEDELNLSYTKIYAPTDGLITNRSVEKGNYIQTAQPLFSIVSDKMWVVANFKETQVANMKKGQSVKIKIDTYPNKKFLGEVDSIQRSTGSKASLFPPENAVGSYVKIVQRVPVKIIFKEDISQYNIVPGMSSVPKVKVK